MLVVVIAALCLGPLVTATGSTTRVRRRVARLCVDVAATRGTRTAAAVPIARRWWDGGVVARLGPGREERQIEAALGDVMDDIASALRAGRSLAVAIDEVGSHAVGPTAGDLQRIAVALRRGDRFDEAVHGWATRRKVSVVEVAAAGLRIAAAVGGQQALAVASVAESVRARAQIAEERHAAAAQARASAMVMVVAPIMFMVCAGAIDASTLRQTVGSPTGLGCLIAGLALDAVGAVWMFRISGGLR